MESFEQGYADEGDILARREARKQNLSDEERKYKASDLISTRNNILTKLPTLLGANGEKTPEYDAAYQSLTQAQQDLGQLYHPDKAPGAIQKDWHFLLGKMHGIVTPKNKTPSQAPRITTTEQPGVAATTSPGMPSEPLTIPATGSTPEVSLATTPAPINTPEIPDYKQTTLAPAPPPVPKDPSWGQAQVLKQKAASMHKAQQEAGLLAAGADLSPQQKGQAQARGDAATRWANLRADISNWDKDNPNASKEDRDAIYSQLYSKWVGAAGKGSWETLSGTIADPSDPNKRVPVSYSFDKSSNRLTNFDGTPVNPEIASTFTPDPKGAGATPEELKEYAADTDPKKGPFPQWLANKRAIGTASAPKSNRDDRYITITQKKTLGQPLTDDERAYLTAYDLWDQKTKIDPGVARAAAFGAMRYIPVVDNSDPNNQGNVIMMRAGEAAKAKVSTPASIGFKTDAAMTKYMTSGQGGTNINYFNTASDHLKILSEAGDALNNGNTQLFNTIANRFATATGDPAPSNFETVKAAVAGELSKTFKGTGATDSEIADINQTINQAQSPQQIQGAINYYRKLMGSKIQALQSQYQAGMQGKPNFPGTSPSGTPQTKGKVSIAAAKLKPKYKGKSDKEISDAITAAGYTPIP